MNKEELNDLRKSLNSVDEEIVALLGKRIDICRTVAELKRHTGIPMMQPKRVDEVKARCAELALEHQVDPDFVRNLYGMIIGETCRVEDEIIEAS